MIQSATIMSASPMRIRKEYVPPVVGAVEFVPEQGFAASVEAKSNSASLGTMESASEDAYF